MGKTGGPGRKGSRERQDRLAGQAQRTGRREKWNRQRHRQEGQARRTGNR